ncbi:hypothetical protein HF521_006879 [Silurus meridionalis]|uniref:Reverse transcriptase domain-containing protein n=1 Tax=Silurus meridionalis TaxID=175797 RepID=A0A8T0ASI3_SILME|nr:hypothetical protein HF521_006879 [Silurus meridionalis]
MSRPKDFRDYRPVALTSHLMKTLERLVFTHLRPLVSLSTDTLQFTYQPGIGVEDAVIFLLNQAISHMEKAGSTVRVMFFDLSSAFNTIQPALLRDKMVYMGVDHHLSAWILDYLTDRPQYVRTRDCESDMIVCNTGAPQGTALAPFLFTVYTADFMFSSATCHLQKVSDDSAIVGLITDDDDREYRGLIQNFVDCEHSGKGHFESGLLQIPGCSHLNNKLEWTDNTEAIYKKGQSRLFLLRRLRSFGVQGELLKTFFDSVVASAIFYGVVCWGSSISTADRKRLDKLIRKASSVLGIPLDTVRELQMVQNAAARLLSNTSKCSHITPVLRSLHWLPVQFRLEYKVLLFVFKAINGLAPAYLAELITVYQPARTLRSSGHTSLVIPKYKYKIVVFWKVPRAPFGCCKALYK